MEHIASYSFAFTKSRVKWCCHRLNMFPFSVAESFRGKLRCELPILGISKHDSPDYQDALHKLPYIITYRYYATIKSFVFDDKYTVCIC